MVVVSLVIFINPGKNILAVKRGFVRVRTHFFENVMLIKKKLITSNISLSQNVNLIPLTIRPFCAQLKCAHERGSFCGVDRIYYAVFLELEN